MSLNSNRIRPLAICIFSHDQSILVFEGYDPQKDETFYRPLGGGIEFGEPGRVALAREVREELGAEIDQVRYLGTLENIFVFRENPGHEIVQVYDARFVDPLLYRQSVIQGQEDDGSPFKAQWKALADFEDRSVPLYPNGLFELLQEWGYYVETKSG
jgi:8-oxo-dGTP pyrophosphatase MutT (NUDIX family)